MIDFELGYTPSNLKYLLHLRNKKREWVAVFFGVRLNAVHSWCVDLGNKNHRDMPFDKWTTLVNALEADKAAMAYCLESILQDLLKDRNLVYAESTEEPTLRCNYKGEGEWDITLGKPHGNAYQPAENEFYLGVGIPADSVDWTDGPSDEWIASNVSGNHIDECLTRWAESILEGLNLPTPL